MVERARSAGKNALPGDPNYLPATKSGPLRSEFEAIARILGEGRPKATAQLRTTAEKIAWIAANTSQNPDRRNAAFVLLGFACAGRELSCLSAIARETMEITLPVARQYLPLFIAALKQTADKDLQLCLLSQIALIGSVHQGTLYDPDPVDILLRVIANAVNSNREEIIERAAEGLTNILNFSDLNSSDLKITGEQKRVLAAKIKLALQENVGTSDHQSLRFLANHVVYVIDSPAHREGAPAPAQNPSAPSLAAVTGAMSDGP